MSKIGGGAPPPGPHHTHRPHGPGKPPQTGAHKQIKKHQKTSDASAAQADASEIDSLDEVTGSRAIEAKSDSSGFSNTPQSEQLQKPPDESEGKSITERYTLAEPHLAAMLSAICTQLDTLAKELEESGLAAPEQQKQGALSLAFATTASELRDILRQVMSGDYGFKLMLDPNTTLGKLFAGLKGWPKRIPPGRKPEPGAPWTMEEWDAFVAWMNEPPPLPPVEDLL
jgi:hypothetical protein